MSYIHILELFSGTEVMGEVLEVGTKVRQLKPGDMVVGLQPIGGGFAEEMIASEVVGICLRSPPAGIFTCFACILCGAQCIE